jgi:hypothetical protein
VISGRDDPSQEATGCEVQTSSKLAINFGIMSNLFFGEVFLPESEGERRQGENESIVQSHHPIIKKGLGRELTEEAIPNVAHEHSEVLIEGVFNHATVSKHRVTSMNG